MKTPGCALGRGGFEATVPPELWPLSRAVTLHSKWAALGQGVAPGCSQAPRNSLSQIRHGGKSKLQLQGWIFPFSSEQGKAGDNFRAALSIITFWKRLQNLWERSEQGG